LCVEGRSFSPVHPAHPELGEGSLSEICFSIRALPCPEFDAGLFFNPFALPRPELVEGSLSKGKD
jgi:hypothetical protein